MIGCSICCNPFGVVDEQLLFECSNEKCLGQYCSSCVEATGGSSTPHPFFCMTCKKEVSPQRNKLIEKHIIWKIMKQIYGIEGWYELKTTSNSTSWDLISNDAKIRLAHLESHLDNLKHQEERLRKQNEGHNSVTLSDANLQNDVSSLCELLKELIKRIEKLEE